MTLYRVLFYRAITTIAVGIAFFILGCAPSLVVEKPIEKPIEKPKEKMVEKPPLFTLKELTLDFFAMAESHFKKGMYGKALKEY